MTVIRLLSRRSQCNVQGKRRSRLSVDLLEDRTLPTVSALQTPLLPATQALSQLMTELTDPASGALVQIVNTVNAAEASVSGANPNGNVATAQHTLGTILGGLVAEVDLAASAINRAGASLPNLVAGSLRQTANELGSGLQGFGVSLGTVSETLKVIERQIATLTVSTLIGSQVAGLPGAASPEAVNSTGQELENLLGNVAENTSALLAGLNSFDGATPPLGAIQGTVTNASSAPLANVPIQLVDATGVVVQSTATNVTGNYSFSVLQNGAYAVREVTPAGYTQTNPPFSTVAPTNEPHAPAAGAFGYYGSTTVLPANWDAMAPFGGDPDQSPVNLSGPTTNLANLVPQLTSSQAGALAATTFGGSSTTVNNTGFQLKVTFNAGTTAPTIQLNGVTYTLAQFHYHDPSENTVDGIAYPMEQHLVFTSSTGSELVVAAFVQVGKTANASFQSILNAAAGLSTTLPSTGSIAGSINLSQLLPSNTQGWYYQGSLTTPPLAGPVNWLVLSTPITISVGQLQQYEADAGELGFLPNARPVQPLNGRQLNEIDNYVNFQTGISPTVTGVNFVLSGSKSIPSLTPDSSPSAADTSLMALASALNNVQASATALYGAVAGIGSNVLESGLLLNVGLDLLNIGHSLWTDIQGLGTLLPAVDHLSKSDATLFFDAVDSEVPNELSETEASVSVVERVLFGYWW